MPSAPARGAAAALIGACAATMMLFASASVALAAADRVPVGKLPAAQADVEVFMAVGASHAQVAAVERRIRTSTKVRRYAHLDHDDAKAEFTRIFQRNPDLVASITPADLPESFPVDLNHAADARAFARSMRTLPGVESAESRAKAPSEAEMLVIIRGCQGSDADVEIFMNLAATQDEIDGATRAVGAESGLTVSQVLGKDDAYAEFRRIFASNPDLVDSITAADLPVSIRAQASGPVSGEVLARLRTLPGVDSVATPDRLCEPIRAFLARGLTPEALARLLVRYSGGLAA